MEHHHRCNHNQSGTGFVLGVMVGIILTFLFVTKKGRKILDILTDEGMERLESLEEIFQVLEDEDVSSGKVNKKQEAEKKSNKPSVSEVQERTDAQPILQEEKENVSSQETYVTKIKTVPRRLFRGIPRKS